MSDRARRRLAWVLFVLPLACAPVAIAIVAATSAAWVQDVTTGPLLVLTFSGVGLLVVLGGPRNAIGWLLLTIGLGVGINTVTSALVEWDAIRTEPFPGASFNVLLHGSLQIAALGVVIPRVLLLFPTGRPPSPRWRVVGWAQIVVLVSLLAKLFEPGDLTGYERAYENPLGVEALGFLSTEALNVPASACFMFGALGAVVSLIVRFRRSVGVERLQLEWVAWGVGVIGASFVANGLLIVLFDSEAIDPFLSLALCLFPITVGIAVLRYRLYEIDRVISRTLVYAALTILLGAAYAGLVLAGQALFSPFAGGSNVAIAVSTLAVAALSLPVRSRVQHFVDRRFYRRRYDAQRTLEAFGARLRQEVELDSLAGELRAVVDEAMQPAHASLWLRGVRS
ncbi:MAG TPA: hypothetical protein VFR43_05355 [Gaiellaceae bacterium]|nr:hypothetical protein [Gaiellaceae bacterium]